MKQIIISTKSEFYRELTNRCCNDQFYVDDNDCNEVSIKFHESGDYVFCVLPLAEGTSCSMKASFSLDLVIKVIKHFETRISKDQIYLFLHSGDYFYNDHRQDGVLNLTWLDDVVPNDIIEYLKSNLALSHIRQFRHTTTEFVWRVLTDLSLDHIKRCDELLRIF